MADQADEPVPAAGGDAHGSAGIARARRRPPAQAVAATLCALLLGLTVWAGWRDIQTRRDDDHREQMVAAGREAVLALTTIDHNEIDRDVQRILDASTGAFHDDFAERAEPFKAAARKAESTSVGTVQEAGLESVEGDAATVLVAATVMTSNRGEPAQQPKSWRTRVTVTRVGDDFKVEAVEFVP